MPPSEGTPLASSVIGARRGELDGRGGSAAGTGDAGTAARAAAALPLAAPLLLRTEEADVGRLEGRVGICTMPLEGAIAAVRTGALLGSAAPSEACAPVVKSPPRALREEKGGLAMAATPAGCITEPRVGLVCGTADGVSGGGGSSDEAAPAGGASASAARSKAAARPALPPLAPAPANTPRGVPPVARVALPKSLRLVRREGVGTLEPTM
jgi:hypothetical protein